MNEAKNSVTYLQKVNFARLEFEEKIEIKFLGRSTPDLNIFQVSQSRSNNYHRKFNSGIYAKHNWLTGCPVKNAFFCFPCLLFGCDTPWTKTGIADLHHLNDKIKKHEKCAEHLRSVCCLGMLGTVDIKTESIIRHADIHNETVKKNRDILSKIVDCLLFCGKMEIPLRKGGFLNELLRFSGKFDEDLINYFERSQTFKGNEKTIQDKLLECILNVCRDEIYREIKKAKYLALMVNDTGEVSERAQNSIVFRYLLDGTVYERFWGFFNPENHDDLSEYLLKQLKIVLGDDRDKLIAQTYDVINGTQKIIKQTYKNAHLVHCYADDINLIMEKAASQNSKARIFTSSLAAIPEFFSRCPSRSAALNSVLRGVPHGSSRRWDFNSRVVNTVSENKECLQVCFESLQQNRVLSTVQASTGLIRTLNDEDFNFWLIFFHQIIPHIDILHSKLLTPQANSNVIHEAVQEFTGNIQEITNNLYLVKQEDDFTSGKRKRLSIESTNSAAKEVCDYIILEAKERFAFTKHLSAAKLFSSFIVSNDSNEIPIFELLETVNAYPTLDKERLTTELSVLYDRPEFKNLKGHKNIYDIMRKSGIHESFVEVFNLLQIIITTPMTTDEPGRCFTTFNRIKTFLKNTTEQNETAFAMVSLEKNMISNIQDFNEKVINYFVNQMECGMEFKYK